MWWARLRKARSGASRASFAIRWSRVETLSEFGASVVFPSSSSCPRRSPFLHGVPRVGSPASPVLLERCDSPPPFLPHFVAFARQYRSRRPSFALTVAGACGREPGSLFAGDPSGKFTAETNGVSQVPG
jgi:hypothetical protein